VVSAVVFRLPISAPRTRVFGARFARPVAVAVARVNVSSERTISKHPAVVFRTISPAASARVFCTAAASPFAVALALSVGLVA
jgi:hypothetical protein